MKRRSNKMAYDLRRNWLTKYKEECGCQNCAQKFAGVALDFHHRPEEIKLFNLANCSNRNFELIKNEVIKCDVLCKNCHALKTLESGHHKKAAEASAGRGYCQNSDLHPELDFKQKTKQKSALTSAEIFQNIKSFFDRLDERQASLEFSPTKAAP
jgi:hypothetical protein